jgi:hypothetical protein
MYGNEPTDGLSATSDPSLILGGKLVVFPAWLIRVSRPKLLGTRHCNLLSTTDSDYAYRAIFLGICVALPTAAGESCMWAETVDPSDLHNTVWPRAAAVAEVLWTPYDVIHPGGAGK